MTYVKHLIISTLCLVILAVIGHAADTTKAYSKLELTVKQKATITEHLYTDRKVLHIAPGMACYQANSAGNWELITPNACFSVIDTRSKLTVSLYRDEIIKDLPADTSKMTALVAQINKLDRAAAQGAQALIKAQASIDTYRNYARAKQFDQSVISELANGMQMPAKQALDILQTGLDDPEFRALLNAALEGRLSVRRQYEQVFTLTNTYVAKLKTDVPEAAKQDPVKVEVEVRLLRPNDPSRIREVSPFSAISNDQATYLDNLAKLRSDLQQKVKELPNAMKELAKGSGKTLAEQVRLSAESLLQEVENTIASMPNLDNFPDLKADLSQLQDIRQELTKDTVTLKRLIEEFETSDDAQADLIRHISLRVSTLADTINELHSQADNLSTVLDKFGTDLDRSKVSANVKAIIDTAKKQLADKVSVEGEKFAKSAQTAVNNLQTLVNEALGCVKLAGDLEEIGRQARSVSLVDPVTDVEFAEVFPSGTSEVAMLSGDQVPVSVTAQVHGQTKCLYRTTLHAYRMGSRWDRVFTTILAQPQEHHSIRPTVGYSTLYKQGNRRSLASNEQWAWGWDTPWRQSIPTLMTHMRRPSASRCPGWTITCWPGMAGT